METLVELICFIVMLGILIMVLPVLVDIAVTFALVMLVIMGVGAMLEAIEATVAEHRARTASA